MPRLDSRERCQSVVLCEGVLKERRTLRTGHNRNLASEPAGAGLHFVQAS